jgi:hypothetical protein
MRSMILAGLLAGAALLSAPQPAAAQIVAVSAEDQAAVREAVSQLDAEMARLAESLGVEAPPLAPLMKNLTTTLFHGLPDDDDLSFAIGFRLRSERIEGGEPDAALPSVLPASGACAAANPGLSVVRFERLDRDGLTGHRCILSGPDEDDPNAHALVSVTVMVDGRRHLENRVAGAASSDMPGRAAEVITSQTTTLSRLAEEMDRTTADLVFALD